MMMSQKATAAPINSMTMNQRAGDFVFIACASA